MTLVEVVIAMLLATLLAAGLFAVGLKARHFVEHSRVTTEARALARERLEEMVALGRDGLAQSSCTLLVPDTNQSTVGYEIIRVPHVTWHTGERAVTGVASGVYAEVRIDVSFQSPLSGRTLTNSYPMIIQ